MWVICFLYWGGEVGRAALLEGFLVLCTELNTSPALLYFNLTTTYNLSHLMQC